MRLQSAITTISRRITVASGLFAPGHLGELTPYVPFEVVDDVLERTGRAQRRLRALPSRVGVYYVIALALFPELSYAGVWRQLTTALATVCPSRVSETALRHLRRRLTAAPFKVLFETLAVPLAPPSTPGVSYRRWRTVAFDGCSSIKTPDSERTRGWLGKVRYRLAWAGYPTLRLMTLVETGTRGLLGACFGPTSTGETAYAARLLPLLDARHLVLLDRGFDANDLLEGIAATSAQFLARLKSTRRPVLLRTLDEGSYLARLGTLTVRIIETDLVIRLADGTAIGGRYRLATTLLDPRTDPAERLVKLYAERWEIESAYFALRSTLMTGRVMRSRDRYGLEQELWATLIAYQLLRMAMTDAALAAGADPDRASFTHALATARIQLTLAEGVTGTESGVIHATVRENLLPPRRPRISARKVKSPISRYHSWHGQARPTISTSVEHIEITLHERTDTSLESPTATVDPAADQHGRTDNPTADRADGPPGDPGGRYQVTLVAMHSKPDTPWHARDLARLLGVTNINSFRVQMSQWSRLGLITKIGPALYRLAS